jgi:hypothetical protein
MLRWFDIMTTLNKTLVLGTILTTMATSTAFAGGTIVGNNIQLQVSQNINACTYQNNGDNTCCDSQPDETKKGSGRVGRGSNRGNESGY